MRTRLPLWGFLALGLVFFYAFFLWQFPDELLRRAIIQKFEEEFPLTLSLGGARISFPAGLRIENIRLSSDSVGFRAPDLKVSPDLAGLFLGRIEWAVRGTDLPPRLEGRIRQEKEKSRLELRLNQLEVEADSPEEFSFSMKVSGELALQWEDGEWEKGTGQGWALVKRGEISGKGVSRVPLPVALFDTLRTEIQLKERKMRVKRLEASGKEAKFSLPANLEFPVKGGLPPELGLVFGFPGGRLPLTPGIHKPGEGAGKPAGSP